MLRHIAGISLNDREASVEVARICGVKPLDIVMRENRLRWFGHVKRRRGGGVLGAAMEMEVTGTRPRGRPRKTWMKNIEEDLRKLSLVQEDAYDRDRWRGLIRSQTH